MTALHETDRFGDQVIDRLRIMDRPASPPRPLRAFEALRCSRQISFRLFGVPQSKPWAMAGQDRLRLGDWVGERIKEVAVLDRGALTEVPFDLEPLAELGGKVDAFWYWGQPDATVTEGKSVTEGMLRFATGGYQSSADRAGPKIEHLVQPALGALALDAYSVHVIYVAVDPDTDAVIGKAEWVVGMDEVLPHVDTHPISGVRGPVVLAEAARAEAARQQQVLDDARAGTLAARFVPGYGYVEHTPPEVGGDPWACTACGWQPTCSKLGCAPIADFGQIAS